jgi:asparagine synthase (glutamine-hydrolysing)
MRFPVNLYEEPVDWTGWRGRLKRTYAAPLGMLDMFYESYEFPGVARYIDRLIKAGGFSDFFLGFRNYVYYRQWFSGPLRDYVKDILLDPRTLKRGYFNRKFLEQAVNDHVMGRRCYSKIFALFISFELWNRLFVDKVPE